MPKAVFLVPQIGCSDVELMTLKTVLEKNSIPCAIASYSTGKVLSKTGIPLNAARSIASLTPEEFDAIIVVGGENVASLAEYDCVIELIRSAYALKKYIVLLCMNSALLLPRAGLLEGRKVTVFEICTLFGSISHFVQTLRQINSPARIVWAVPSSRNRSSEDVRI